MDNVGTTPSRHYYIQNDSLFIESFSSDSFLNIGKITLEKGLLKISNNKELLTYRKIKDGLTLEDVIKSDENKNGLGPIFFKRMDKWKREVSEINK